MEIRIKGFEDYTIDEYGNIRSYKHKKSIIMKPWIDSKGRYVQIALCKNNEIFKKLVHRLVAEAFLDNPTNLPEVNHIDRNTQNNHVSNLEWCDRKYNLEQSYETMSPVRNFIECDILKDGEYLFSCTSKVEASKIISVIYGASQSSLCRYGKNKGFEIIERCND